MEGQGFVRNVQDYECRMTDHPVNYATHISSTGGPNDKTVLHIESLDFDFLETVIDWVHDTFTEGELTGDFKRTILRAPEFMDGYRVTFYPSQNKKGVAAKQQLFYRFFHPDGTRLDMMPAEERVKVLADIEKAKVNQRKETMMERVYKAPDDTLYKISSPGGAQADVYVVMMLPAEPGSQWVRTDDQHQWPLLKQRAAQEYLGTRALSEGWRVATDDEIMYTHAGRPVLIGEEKVQCKVYKVVKGALYGVLYKVGEIGELGNADRCKLTIKQLGTKPGSVWRKKPMAPEWNIRNHKDAEEGLEAMAEQEGWELASEAEIRYNRTERVTLLDDGTQEESLKTQNPTSSAAATAAADEPAESLGPAVLTPTTETAAAVSEQADNATTVVPALDGMSASFDYSGLDAQTINVMHMAENEIREARQGYIVHVSAAVASVHEAVVAISDNGEDGKFKTHDTTFTAWCAYVGIKRDAAYRFLQVHHLLNDATPEEAAQLEQASPSLLYAAAKPSAPAELVQAVKDGDITSHKQYQEAMARIKQMEHDAELDHKERDSAYAKADQYKAECDRRAQDQRRLEGLVETATQKADLANKKSAEVWNSLVAEKEARIRAENAQKAAEEKAALWEDKWNRDMPEMQRLIDEADDQAEAAKKALAAAGAPIEATVADPEEIERRAKELVTQQLAQQASPLEATVFAFRQMFLAAWTSSQLEDALIQTEKERDAFDGLSQMLGSIVDDIDDAISNYEEGI